MAICFLGTTTFYLLFQKIKRKPAGEKALALAMKGLATLFSAALAVYGAVFFPAPGHWALAIGLVVCAAADVLLRLNFLWGMGAFALGHAAYSIAYIRSAPPAWPSLIVFVVLAGGCCLFYPAIKKCAGERKPLPYLGYALMLCVMLALAVPQKPVLLLGAALFVVSDAMLARGLAVKETSTRYDYVCLGVYYLAQFLIGASTLL